MSAAFPERVRRAARRLAGRHRGANPFDQKFDDCFETGDGVCVIVMLMRHAETDVALRLGIRLHKTEADWRDVAEAHAHLDNAAIARKASQLRAAGRVNSPARLAPTHTDTGWYDV